MSNATEVVNNESEPVLENAGILLWCPQCGEARASIDVRLADPYEFHCNECDNDFTASYVRTMIESVARWPKVLKWLATMPSMSDD